MVGEFLKSSIVSSNDKLAVESFARLACFGPSLIPVKERERVPGKVQLKVSNQRFVDSCLANSLTGCFKCSFRFFLRSNFTDY